MKKTLFIMMCFALVLSFGLYVGCQQEEVVEEAAEEEEEIAEFEGLVDVDHESWEIGKPGGTFIRSTFGSDPKTFNVAVAAETSTTDVTGQLYAEALRRNQLTLDWEPALAKRYEFSDDEKTVTFYLQEGTKFSDGEEVTAEDFVFSANQVFLREDVGSNYRSGLFQIGRAHV
jgi:peptide/nickel transport system substrate-binding protein